MFYLLLIFIGVGADFGEGSDAIAQIASVGHHDVGLVKAGDANPS
jgi:hypothetical protein